jgi:uncharacterized protein
MSGQGTVSDFVMEQLRTKDRPIAVVGASGNPAKYGNIITRNLTGKGYEIIPVNPKESSIEGLTVVASAMEAAGRAGILDFVVPPAVALSVLKQLVGTDVTIWLQDGSFDDEVISFAEANFSHVVHHACIMVVTNLA